MREKKAAENANSRLRYFSVHMNAIVARKYFFSDF